MITMAPADPLLVDAHPIAGGWLVIPPVLPIHVPRDALSLTVGEWLNLTAPETT